MIYIFCTKKKSDIYLINSWENYVVTSLKRGGHIYCLYRFTSQKMRVCIK